MSGQSNKPLLRQAAGVFGFIVPFVGLVLMMYIGRYNRYWGDDWCYNYDFKTLGIDGAIKTYFMTGPEALRGYSNNRYSLTLISGLLYFLGIFGAQITATLVITSWFMALYWAFSNVSKLTGLLTRSSILLGSATLLYYVLYISPQRFQVLYWTAGIHYSLAIISGIYLMGLIMFQAASISRNKWIDLLAVPVAFLAGGFSETGNAFLLACMSFVLLAIWLLKKRKIAWAIKAFPTTIIAFITLFVSLLVLAFAPSNVPRTEVVSADRNSLAATIILSLRFAVDFMLISLRSLPVPHLVFIAFYLFLPMLSETSTSEKPISSFRNVILSILVIIIIVWLIIAAVQAPSVMFYGAPPDPRGKSLARFIMLLGLAAIAWCVGREVHARWDNKWLPIVSILVVLGCGLYTARTISRVYAEIPGFSRRAELWDARDAVIKQAVRENQTQLEVLVIDMQGLGVQDIMKSKDMTGEWVVTCGGKFYGVQKIKAGQP